VQACSCAPKRYRKLQTCSVVRTVDCTLTDSFPYKMISVFRSWYSIYPILQCPDKEGLGPRSINAEMTADYYILNYLEIRRLNRGSLLEYAFLTNIRKIAIM
jgi:hypothetical protein